MIDLVNMALENGATKAALLAACEIPFNAELRAYCEANACGTYGKNYGCPPYAGTPEEVMARAKEYENALVFQTVSELEDSFDFEGMMEAGARHKALTAELYEKVRAMQVKCLPLSAGACSVCEKCACLEHAPCRFPDRAISSLEAYCVNVSLLAGKCGMRYTNGENTVTYFSAILF